MKKTVLAFSLILLLSLFLINNVKARIEERSCNTTYRISNFIECEYNYYYEYDNGKYYESLRTSDERFKCYYLNSDGTWSNELEFVNDYYYFQVEDKEYAIYSKLFLGTSSNFDPSMLVDNENKNGSCKPIIKFEEYKDSKARNGAYTKYFTTGDVHYANTSTNSDDGKSDNKPNTDNKPTYNPYDDIVKCEGAAAINSIPSCWCMPAAVADITSFIYWLLRVGGPILLIILGAIDLGKAIVATDESGIKKAKKKLVNKFVAAACIFLVLSIIQMIVNITGGGRYGNLDKSNKNCLYYLLYGYES